MNSQETKMPAIKYRVTLTAEETEELKSLTHKGKSTARKQTRARILLKAAEGCPDKEIMEALDVSASMVGRIRQRCVEEGIEAALEDRPRPGAAPKLTEKQCAQVIAVACTPAPEGHDHWTLRLLADQVVQLGFADSFSHEAVRQLLKKNTLKPWQQQEWCIPEVGADFVAPMEDVLDLYEAPYDPAYPVVCFDESPKQLVGEVRRHLTVEPGAPARFDTEYVRHGVRDVMMICEPKRGWREVLITERRTRIDFAHTMKHVVECFPEATTIRLVMDNLNTHKPASLYASTLIKTDPFSLTKRDPSDAQERAWCAVKVVVEKVNALACEGLTERI
jgi:transposase